MITRYAILNIIFVLLLNFASFLIGMSAGFLLFMIAFRDKIKELEIPPDKITKIEDLIDDEWLDGEYDEEYNEMYNKRGN